MVGELASALPHEGGYYTWVRRALGPFWGMQEAWLMVAFSLFDMAIYPTLLVTYLGRIFPVLRDTGVGGTGWLAGVAMVVVCVLWNLRGSRAVGSGSIGLGALLLFPFVVVSICGALAMRHSGFDQFVATLTAAPATAPAAQSLARCGSPASCCACGTTLAGTAHRRWPARSTSRSATIRVRCSSPSSWSRLATPFRCSSRQEVACRPRPGPPARGSRSVAGSAVPGSAWRLRLAERCAASACSTRWCCRTRLPLAMVRDGLLPTWLGKRSAGAEPQPRAVHRRRAVHRLHGPGLPPPGADRCDLVRRRDAAAVRRADRPARPRAERRGRSAFNGGVLGLLGLAALPMGLLALALWFWTRGRHAGHVGLGAMQTGLAIAAVGPCSTPDSGSGASCRWPATCRARRSPGSVTSWVSFPAQNRHHHAATAATAAAVSSSVIAGLH